MDHRDPGLEEGRNGLVGQIFDESYFEGPRFPDTAAVEAANCGDL